MTTDLIRRSPAEELHIERDWARFLGVRRGGRWWTIHVARWLKYGVGRLQAPDPRSATRLLNIELSHLDLMRRGVQDGARLVLILEDDAGCADAADLAAGIRGLVEDATGFDLANLSESFTAGELGVTHLLSSDPQRSWAGSHARDILIASKPVTNTVCALLYGRDFLERLITTFDQLPIEPVAPIDWKLNRALMAMAESGGLRDDGCLWVEPAPIIQRSMHG